jgi:hypothetical protein
MCLRYIWAVASASRSRPTRTLVSVLINSGKSELVEKRHLHGRRTGQMIARTAKRSLRTERLPGVVLDTEPNSFQTRLLRIRTCTMPTRASFVVVCGKRRRSTSLLRKKACEHWGEGKDDCVFDLLTTDLENGRGGRLSEDEE